MAIGHYMVDAVGKIVGGAAAVAVEPHGTGALLIVDGVRATVYRQLLIIGAEAIAVRIRIGEDPPLEHFVRRITDAIHHVSRSKSRLLYGCKIIVGYAV